MINRLTRKILGLDIRSDAVSAALVKSTIKGRWLDHARFVPIAQDAEDNTAAIRSAVHAAVAGMDLTGAACAASCSFGHLSFRNISLPFKEKKKIRQILPLEMEALLPYPPENLLLDFKVLAPEGDGSAGADVITAAVFKTEMEALLGTLQSLRLDPDWVAPSGQAAALLLEARKAPDKENWILIDVERQWATFVFAPGGRIKTIRRFSLPLEAEAKAAHVAEKLRHTLPALAAGMLQDGNSWRGYFTGTEPFDGPAFDLLEKRLTMPVHRLNLVKDAGIRLLSPPDASFDAPALDHALALCLAKLDAIQPINFRTGPFAPKNFWVEYKPDIIRSSVFAAAVLLLLFTGFIVDQYVMAKKVDRVDRQIRELYAATFPDDKLTSDPLAQMKVKIRDEQKPLLFDDKIVSNVRAIDIINDISRMIPENTDVVLTKLVISPGNVIISGTTDTFNSVDDMKNRLEQAERFTAVTITSANLERSGSRVDFKLKIQTR